MTDIHSNYDIHKTYVTMGASNHAAGSRAPNDYYATDPDAVEKLLDIETFSHDILEPCCGEGHISSVLERRGHNVKSFDLIDRGYGEGGVDFFEYDTPFDGDIVTNPPYSEAQKFVEHAMDIVTDGHKVAMLLKLTFLEGKGRKAMFAKYPPKVIYVSSSRISCAKNGDFIDRDKNGNPILDKDGNIRKIGSAICFAWFIWEKGYKGDIVIRHFN